MFLYSPYSVAEHAAALLLALNRKIIGQNSCKWATTVWIIWWVLTYGKTVGIIGTGKIGAAFAKSWVLAAKFCL
jgi:D-lactate dehydrogenase